MTFYIPHTAKSMGRTFAEQKRGSAAFVPRESQRRAWPCTFSFANQLGRWREEKRRGETQIQHFNKGRGQSEEECWCQSTPAPPWTKLHSNLEIVRIPEILKFFKIDVSTPVLPKHPDSTH
jgi:hypothetical protein